MNRTLASLRWTILGLGGMVSAFSAESALLAQSKPVGQQEPRVYPWRVQLSDSAVAPGSDPVPPGIVTGRDRIRLFQASALQQDPVPASQGGAGASLSDDPANPPATVPTPGVEQNPGLSVPSNARPEDDIPGRRSGNDRCQLGEVQRIFQPTSSGLTVGGFSQIGYHTRDSLNFNDREDKLNLHQTWLYVDRAADPCAGRNFGFRVDGLYGIDGQELQAIGNSPTGAPTGWDNSWDHGSYGFALPQAYLEYDNSETSLRLGRFLSPIGFESVPSVENFFYSRTWARTYSEPFSHTGVLLQRSTRPGLTTFAGATLGWNSAFENTDNGFNLLTGLNYVASDRVTLGLAGSMGDTGYRGSGVIQTATAQVRLTDRVLWGLQGDFVNLQSNDELGLTNYLFYCHSACLSLGTRLEWWKSDQLFGSSASTWGATTGINWRPHANVVIRPEFRVDGGAAALHQGDPIIGIDAIILF